MKQSNNENEQNSAPIILKIRIKGEARHGGSYLKSQLLERQRWEALDSRPAQEKIENNLT
jgi:hypothetical protein